MWICDLIAGPAPLELGDHERLLGWLYVGDVAPAFRDRLEASKKPALDPAPFLGRMPQG